MPPHPFQEINMAEAKQNKDSSYKYYESREKEPYSFNCADYKPIRNFTSGRLEWEIPTEDIDRFERHHFVEIGRVVPKLIQERGA